MENRLTTPSSGGRTKFFVGGLLILAAVIYLIISSTQASAHYFLTIDELKAKGEDMYGRNVRISGAVLGDTINYDPYTFTLEFAVANVPGTNREIDAQGGLSKVLYDAVNDPNRTRLNVIYTKGPKPDLLQHEAQAIMTGKMGEDGYFYADELLLKCPTKYEEIVAGQVEG